MLGFSPQVQRQFHIYRGDYSKCNLTREIIDAYNGNCLKVSDDSMKEYDVVIVGAGPAGSAAAKAAAERGVKTILLEDHPQIGLPQHCCGLLHGSRSGITDEILKTMDGRVVLAEVKARRIFSPSGKMMEVPLQGKGCYIIDRGLFDMQLAAQAAQAGAEILVNTKVTSLLTHDGTISGVTTSSRTMPEVLGKVVIAADGIRAILKGIPTWAGLLGGGTDIISGITWWLAGVKDVEPGVPEFHLGAFGGQRGCVWLLRHDSSTCIADFLSFENMEQCRRADWALSKKIRDAVPMRITGWSIPMYLGKPLPVKVKPGLILAGSAAGYNGTLTCLLSGRYAGEVAAEAVLEGNLTEETLTRYEKLCERLQESRKLTSGTFFGLSDEELEKLFEQMNNMDDLNFDVLEL